MVKPSNRDMKAESRVGMCRARERLVKMVDIDYCVCLLALGNNETTQLAHKPKPQKTQLRGGSSGFTGKKV